MRTLGEPRLAALAVLALLATACSGSGTGDATKTPIASAGTKAAATPAPPARPQLGPPKTEKLPADGGDVGKAYNELVAAYQAVDATRAGRLLDQYGSKEPFTLEKDLVDTLLPDMLKVHVTGGAWQADRATLFVDGEGLHGYLGASLTATGWIFDNYTPSPRDEHFLAGPDCKTSKWFPCGAASFPDAQVSGRVHAYPGVATDSSPASGVLLDGFGVRVLDANAKALKYTEVVLSGTAFEPHALAGTDLIIYENSSQPVLRLRIAPDGKTTKLAFVQRSPEIDATAGTTLDTSTPDRLRGHLKFDAKDVAQFDVTFDVGTLSQCLSGDDRCGNAR